MEANVRSVYNQWANSYDEMENKTRDLDRTATINILSELITPTTNVLEFGCGTGKNTEWLVTKTKHLSAVDFSEEMLAKAKEKFTGHDIKFLEADIAQTWPFDKNIFNLVTCNLILEHVENLPVVFSEARRVLKPGGYFLASELHPAKQYKGAKANFEINNQTMSPSCYTHHVSDYFAAATSNGFACIQLKEWFDDNDRSQVPRLITFLFRKDERVLI